MRARSIGVAECAQSDRADWMLDRPSEVTSDWTEDATPLRVVRFLRADVTSRAERTRVDRPETIVLAPMRIWAVDVSMGAWRAWRAALSDVTSADELERAVEIWVVTAAKWVIKSQRSVEGGERKCARGGGTDC